VLVLDKPLGISSAAACNAVRRRTGGAKVGHAGTLDPLATGVLVACLGKATKAIPLIQSAPKRYLAEVDLSAFTTTDDAEGEREAIAVSEPPDRDAVQRACREFEGEIEQRPPVYSAVHIEGRRAYEMARKGELAERPPARLVRIDAVDVVAYAWPIATLDVRSGKGVYIRSLARDLGERLGTGGALRSLRRTAVGGYAVEVATPLDALPEKPEAWTADQLLPAPEMPGRDQPRSRS